MNTMKASLGQFSVLAIDIALSSEINKELHATVTKQIESRVITWVSSTDVHRHEGLKTASAISAD